MIPKVRNGIPTKRILPRIGITSENTLGEWVPMAPPGSDIDPNVDMNRYRYNTITYIIIVNMDIIVMQ